jgi:hypothetical protein
VTRRRGPVTRRPLGALLLLAGLLVLSTARAQGVPEALRGAWQEGPGCGEPVALLVLTARAAVRVPLAPGEPVRLLRFETMVPAAGGWLLGHAGPRRLALRTAEAGGLETTEPAAKTRDDQLPGAEAVRRAWRRCTQPPVAALALHAEGLALLAALEHVEATCGDAADLRACLAAILVQADITGDGALSLAELARLGRGLGWLATAEQGGELGVPAFLALAEGGQAFARRLLDGLDYDGDGRLSLTELAQDRAPFAAATGTAEGRPAPGALAAGPLALIRAALSALGGR